MIFNQNLNSYTNQAKLKQAKISSYTNSNLNSKYNELRLKLDNLNIYNSYDINSYEIINNLVEIIYKLNENKSLKEIELNNYKKDYNKKDILIKSLISKKEVLVSENNELHKQIINFERSINKSIQAKEIEIKRLTNEKEEMKLLNNTYIEKIRNTEKDYNTIKKKIYSIINKLYDFNLGEAGLKNLFKCDDNIKKFKYILNASSDLFLDNNLKKNKDKNQDSHESIKIDNDYNIGDLFKPSINMNYSIINQGVEYSDKKLTKSNLLNKALIKVFAQNKNNNSIDKKDYKSDYILLKKSNENLNLKIKNIESENSNLKDKLNECTCNKNNNNTKYLNQDVSIASNNNESEYIIEYLIKEKKDIEEKNNLKEDCFIKEINKYKDLYNKLQSKMFNNNNKYSKNTLIDNTNETTKLKNKIDDLSYELKNLKTCTIQQNEEINEYKNQIKVYKSFSVRKEELLKYEEINKDIQNQLINTRKILTELDFKNKELCSISNSEKSLLNNKIIELKKDNMKLKNSLITESLKKDEFIDLNNKNTEKINSLSSILFQKESIIQELSSKLNK